MHEILLIEDNDMNAEMLSRRLRRRGFAVQIAADGREGIAMALSEAPQLILMDIDLPEIDGAEATRRLKADERTRHIPIIALTAHAMTTDRDAALAAGCNDFDTKPVDIERLLQKIHAQLSTTACSI